MWPYFHYISIFYGYKIRHTSNRECSNGIVKISMMEIYNGVIIMDITTIFQESLKFGVFIYITKLCIEILITFKSV